MPQRHSAGYRGQRFPPDVNTIIRLIKEQEMVAELVLQHQVPLPVMLRFDNAKNAWTGSAPAASNRQRHSYYSYSSPQACSCGADLCYCRGTSAGFFLLLSTNSKASFRLA